MKTVSFTSPRFISVLTAVFLSALPSQAGILDSFSAVQGGDPDLVSLVGNGFGPSVDFNISPLVGDPFGSRRRLEVDQFAPGESATLTLAGTSGIALLSSSGNATSEWTIIYGVGGVGLHLDATAGGATSFLLTFDTASSNLEYVIGATGYTASGTSNGGNFQPLTTSILVPFSSFSNAVNVDFTDLNQISIRIRNAGLTRGGGAELTEFSTVPEPATAGLLALGGLVAAIRRRR